MKLISCYVRSFGAIKDFSFDFNTEINTIVQENGWGKTTFSMFLKSMFYGLIDTTKRSIDENARKKYYTWFATEKIGGYVDFEWGGKRYRIERYFGLKAKDDTVRLTDLDTGKEYSNTDNLGQRLFKVDEQGFENTVFFGQTDLTVQNNTSVTALLTKNSKGDSDALNCALKSLSDEAKKYKYNRGGLIDETEKKIFDCKERLSEISTAEIYYEDVCLNLKNNKIELARGKEILQEKRAEKEKFDKAESVLIKKRYFEENKLKLEKLSAEKNEIVNKLGGENITEERVDNFAKCVNELTGLQAKINQKSIELERAKTQEKPSGFASFNQTMVILFAVSVLALLGGVFVSIFANLVIGISLIVAGALVSVISAIKIKSSVAKSSPNENELVPNLENELAELTSIKTDFENKLNSFISKMNLESADLFGAVIELKTAVKELARVNQEILEKENSLKDYNFEEVNSSQNYTENYGKQLALEISDTERKCSDLQIKITKDESSKTLYEEKISKRPEIENQLEFLTEELQKYKEKYELINQTAKFLVFADEKLRTKYRKPLEDKANEYFSLVTKSSDKRLSVDVDLALKIEDKGSLQDKEYYSEGYKNLINICERFALVDLIFEDEKPFIVLDDPFVNLDGERLKAVLACVKELSKSFQIVYMTCHESRVI